MLVLAPLIVALPLAGSIVLGLAGRRLSPRAAAAVGVGSVGLAALVSIIVAVAFLVSPPEDEAGAVRLWTWIDVGAFVPGISFYVDALAVIMVLVVTVVGFLIHLYSVEYMDGDEHFARFFAFMNLFVASMAILVLAEDLLLLYLGWEGVGLASYLLIGFWYRDPLNGRAARKAFIVTRVGDALMAVGLFLLFTELGSLEIQYVLASVEDLKEVRPGLVTGAALLLLGGAVGKSAQLPLQTWLPDAMAGPTPVSALIHAATMVTAGVYLVARMHALFEASDTAMTCVATLGAVTLLVGASSALAQQDIKRVLAYSTMSQIGYMFLALGVGAFSAAMFHFMTHAFFKALLFLGAGSVILALHHEQDLRRMGGLREELPLTFWTFLIGASSLAALPLVTAGFYSKDAILWEVWASARGGPWLWAAGVAGAFLTALYSFRLVFVAFFGKRTTPVSHRPGRCASVPLVVLAVLAVIGGFVELPHTLGGLHLFSGFLAGALPAPEEHAGASGELLLQLIASFVTLAGVLLAWLIFLRRPRLAALWKDRRPLVAVERYAASGWGFDALWDSLLVRPFIALARVSKGEVADRPYRGIARLAELAHAVLGETQTGRLRWYVAGVAAGGAAVLAVVVLS